MYKLCALLLLTLIISAVHAQSVIIRDPAIERMVAEINIDSLKGYVNRLVSFGSRHTLSNKSDSRKGIGAARNWVVAKFNEIAKNSNGRMTVELDRWMLQKDGKRIDTITDMGNPMATLKGIDPADKRIFIISAHLDSRVTDVLNRKSDAPGANDDGSGTAAVIESARVMSRYSFPATIIFAALSGEEQGLLGGERLSERAVQNNWQLSGVLNNDIMGSNNSNETTIIDNTRVRVFSEGLPASGLDKKAAGIRQMGLENDGSSRQLARYVKEIGERYVSNLEVVLVYRNDRFLRGGDHTPFVQKGFPAVRITEMNENYEHQHQDVRVEKGIRFGDLAEFMDFEYLKKNTAVNVACLANLASSPSLPEEVKVDVKNLTNSTYLYWKKPVTGKIRGYYVLMRETYQGLWQKKFFTTATEMRLPYSKDNYFFAVQSVSENGHESLPVVPEIGR